MTTTLTERHAKSIILIAQTFAQHLGRAMQELNDMHGVVAFIKHANITFIFGFPSDERGYSASLKIWLDGSVIKFKIIPSEPQKTAGVSDKNEK